jgi:hypothetical protein
MQNPFKKADNLASIKSHPWIWAFRIITGNRHLQQMPNSFEPEKKKQANRFYQFACFLFILRCFG